MSWVSASSHEGEADDHGIPVRLTARVPTVPASPIGLPLFGWGAVASPPVPTSEVTTPRMPTDPHEDVGPVAASGPLAPHPTCTVELLTNRAQVSETCVPSCTSDPPQSYAFAMGGTVSLVVRSLESFWSYRCLLGRSNAWLSIPPPT